MNGWLDLPLAMFPAEILQRLGYHSTQVVMKKVRDVLMSSMDEVRELAHPQALICTLPLVPKEQGMVLEGTDLVFNDPQFLEGARSCSLLSVFVVTMGMDLEARIRDYEGQEEEVKAEVLRAIQEDVLDQAGNLLRERLITQGLQDGFQLTHILYMDEQPWSMALVPQLLPLLKNKAGDSFEVFDASWLESRSMRLGMIGWIPFATLEE